MPSPGTPVPPRLPIEDSYFELLADTLESLDYVRSLTSICAKPKVYKFGMRCLRAVANSPSSSVAKFP